MAASNVLIVGAGPTGLILALHLAHYRIPFRIIDTKPGPGQASRAMGVHARTLEFYAQLGIAEEVVAGGIKMERVHLKEEGEEVTTLALKDIGEGLSPFPYMLCYPQDDHEHLLVAKLGGLGVEVEWNTSLESFSQSGDGVRAVLLKNGKQDVCEVAYLCACDGASSPIRQALGLAFTGGTYERRFYVADVKLAGGGTDDMYATLGAGGIGLILPVRSTGMKRLIGTVPEEFHERTDVTFDEVKPALERLLDIRIDEINWFSTYRVHHRVATHFRVDRVFLAGDAGHIHSPIGAQGMNTGIGDAVNLAWKLAQALQGRAEPAILDSYEAERIGFARRLVDSTDKAFRSMVDKSWSGKLLRTVVMPNLAPLLIGFSMVRRAIFSTVSQVRINYRDSPLSEGEAGEIEGGERLPWVPAVLNFDPLKSLDWQLHIYGAAEPALMQAAEAMELPVFAYGWTADADRAGLKQNAAYLVRPDGYVGLALPDQDAAALQAYAGRLGLHFRR
jgi:2-polyprenyl-6-methoxyphenol hydroxylase-like FAD-dependent oxidoreductase